MDHVAELFKAMDVNSDGTVTKIEFLEFLREHKPKHGPWASIAKLQASFGLDTKTSVDLASFKSAFAAAKSKGLEPETFEYRFAPVVTGPITDADIERAVDEFGGATEVSALPSSRTAPIAPAQQSRPPYASDPTILPTISIYSL